jgi:hypothetical protein
MTGKNLKDANFPYRRARKKAEMIIPQDSAKTPP